MTETAKPRATVLLVEDDSAHAELFCRALDDDAGCQIVRLRNGEEALNYLHRRNGYSNDATSPWPQLVLLDLRLPKVDGLEVLRDIKASPALVDVPVVIFTTSDAEKDRNAAYASHANGYVVKPDEFEQLRKLMGDLRRYWLNWNQSSRLPC